MYKLIETMKAWLVKDKCGVKHLFKEKPFLDPKYFGYWNGAGHFQVSQTLLDLLTINFTEKVIWNGEPIQVEIEIKEVKNEI